MRELGYGVAEAVHFSVKAQPLSPMVRLLLLFLAVLALPGTLAQVGYGVSRSKTVRGYTLEKVVSNGSSSNWQFCRHDLLPHN
jgi:hypothetical protein